jgi:tape measure domain-containing protein
MSQDAIDIRVRLQGGKVASVEADGVARSVDGIGSAAERSTGKLAGLRASLAGFAGPAGKLGEATRTSALYIGGFAAAVTGVGAAIGLNFNAKMEQATIGFTHFLGSTQKARAYLDDLYKLAATTPFEFSDLVSTTQQFLAFGYSAKEARGMLGDLADAAAGLGKSGAELAPVTLALGQIKAAGTLKGQDLNQLTSFGISATSIAKNLGMSYKDMRKQMEKGKVGSEDALKAIRKTMQQQFGGMAKAQSKTFTGQLSTLRDMAAQGLGKLTMPLFEWLRDKGLPGLNAALPGIQRSLAGVFHWLGVKVPQAIRFVKKGWASFMDAVRPALPFWKNVLGPLLKGFAIGVIGSVIMALKVVVPAFKGLMIALGWVGEKARPLRGFFQGIGTVLGFLFGGPVLKGIGLLGKFGGVFRLVGTAAKLAALPIRLVGMAGGLMGRMVGGALERIATAPGKALSGLRHGLAVMLDLLRSAGAKFVSAGKSLWDALVRGIRSALGDGLGFAKDLGKGVANAAIGFLNAAIPNRIPIPGPLPDLNLPDNPIPKLWTGGVVRQPGRVIVGDDGPEALSLPAGARVDPLPKLGPVEPLAGGGFVVRTTVNIDGRPVAEAVGRAVADRDARR